MDSIEHVSDFIRCIEQAVDVCMPTCHFLYRGEDRNDYQLIPALYRWARKDGGNVTKYLIKNGEVDIIQQFMLEAAGYIKSIRMDDRFVWVEYAQHFGVPTRLLDWTSNPLVALYFACCSKDDSVDGKVYVLNHSVYQKLSSIENIEMEGKIIKEEAAKMIWEDGKGFPYPIVFRPYYFDQRMSAQASCFMVWGSIKKTFDKMIDDLEKVQKVSVSVFQKDRNGVRFNCMSEEPVLTNMIIPGKRKMYLLQELDRLGVNQASLFPGLDGIGRAVEWRNNIVNFNLSDWI